MGATSTTFDFLLSYHSSVSTEEATSHKAVKALFCASTFILAEIVWNQHTKWCISPTSAFAEPLASLLPNSSTLLQSSRSLPVSSGTSFEADVEGGNGFEVTLGLVGLVLWIGGVARYCLGLKILSGMEGCPVYLSFNMGVSHSIIAIIFLMYSLIFSGGSPSCAQQLVTKQHVLRSGEAVLMCPVPDCPNKFIEGWCPGSDSTNSALKHRCHVFFTLTRYPRDELNNADHHDVVSICCPLIFTFAYSQV